MHKQINKNTVYKMHKYINTNADNIHFFVLKIQLKNIGEPWLDGR